MFTLKVDSVQLSYQERKVLQDVHLQCHTGEILGILGRNGSGKSSLLKIMFGAITPAYKYISINDRPLTKGYIHNHLAYLPQHNYLPGGITIRHLSKAVVRPADWEEFSSHEIYHLHAHKKVGQLSGGEQRQLEILLVLYNLAPFILLDEPFTHISPIQAEALKDLIRKRTQHKGIIITDHQYYNVLEVAHRLILIQNGCTKPIADPEELITYGYLSGTKTS